MLRTVSADKKFRALATKPFETGSGAAILGRRTLIYGRNGTGKTTFSELLRQVALSGDLEGVQPALQFRFDGSNTIHGASNLPADIYVYNRYYVLDSLGLFLDGRGDSPPILKLGQKNVDLAARLEHLDSHVTMMAERHQQLQRAAKEIQANRTLIEKEVKADIIAALAPADELTYNSTRYQVNRARALLEDAHGVVLDERALALELAQSASPMLPRINELPPFPAPRPDLGRLAFEVLTARVEVEAIARISNPRVSEWIEVGRELHEVGDTCIFCGVGTITADLMAEYARHFSESYSNLRDRITAAIEYFDSLADRLTTWLSLLPSDSDLIPSVRESFVVSKTSLDQDVAATLEWIAGVRPLLVERRRDPAADAWSDDRTLPEFPGTAPEGVIDAVRAHNSSVADQDIKRSAARRAVEEHFGASKFEAYRALGGRAERADRAMARVRGRETALREQSRLARQAQQDTGEMASLIDSDLKQRFGHSHLGIEVTEDGKGYLVVRNGTVAMRLSEGERNAIAFCYFLRALEADGVNPGRSLVVIDDPMTSMDKEALFAAFALVQDRTKRFRQVVMLTHDFEFFRLGLRQLEGSRKESARKIANGDREEAVQPRVAVLETKALVDAVSGERTCVLVEMPKGLLRHPSEYHYLFLRVAESIQRADPETLPLMGNAARRLLEGFISFRAPAGDHFQQKVDSIRRSSGLDDVLAQRVVKFLHGHSHREDPRPTSALDFPSIENELRAALEFMRSADPTHFDEMAKSVGLDSDALASALGKTPTASS